MPIELNQAELAALPDEALLAHMEWLDMPCSCPTHPSCTACSHAGHPDALRETYFHGAD